MGMRRTRAPFIHSEVGARARLRVRMHTLFMCQAIEPRGASFHCCCSVAGARAPLLSAENLTEAGSLSRSLRNRTDIRPLLYGWTWSEASPWPPVKAVLKTAFWSDPMYEQMRERLVRAAPEVAVEEGGEFQTLRTTAMRDQPAADLVQRVCSPVVTCMRRCRGRVPRGTCIVARNDCA